MHSCAIICAQFGQSRKFRRTCLGEIPICLTSVLLYSPFMKKIEILLVDDNALVRAAINRFLDGLDDFAVIAEAANIAEAMEALERTMPTVVVTDLSMGFDNGLDLVRALKELVPGTGTIVLSMHSSEAIVAEALKCGASAYVLKEEAPEELEIAIRAVVRGDIYLSAAVSKKMVKWFSHSPNSVRPVLPS